MTEPLTFEEWWQADNFKGKFYGPCLNIDETDPDSAKKCAAHAYAAGVASQQADFQTRANSQVIAAMKEIHRKELAEKEAEIEHLHKALSLTEMGRQVSVPFARYEAVVEAARELVSPCKHERGFCVAHGTVRLPCSVAELRAALAALDEA